MKKVYIIVLYQSMVGHGAADIKYITETMDDAFWEVLAPYQGKGYAWAVEEWELDKKTVWNGGQRLNGIEIASYEDLRSFKESLLLTSRGAENPR